MTPIKWFRISVLTLIFYLGWLGVMVFITPVVVYLELRDQGANIFQAVFLAAFSCYFVSWLILTVFRAGGQ